ncbi:MAG: YfhO family protein [Chitinophagaceae bacterium]
MSLPSFFLQNRVHYKNYLLLLLICLLAYWPLTFGIFSVKNDALHYFLPYRFEISEALRNGEFPFWSPYLYLGYPVQGDMQSGAWNPVVWIFSAIGRYDLTLFHYENLLYIFLGSVGMYKLTNRLSEHSQTALLIAASYMLSGFMLSGQLINWLSAAAFIPFVIHYYLLALDATSVKNPIKAGIALFFLFTSSYPSFFILTGYLLILLFLVTIVTRFRNKKISFTNWKKILLHQLLIAAVFTGLALPAFVSFIDLLPYYQRGGGTSYLESSTNAFEAQHFLTLLFPGTIKANDIVSYTDVTCRNIYFGIIPLIILFALPPKWNRRNILLALLAVFSLLFSLGDATPVRKICYDLVPLLDTFRHPSQMRLFFILAVLLLAAPGLKRILNNEISPVQRNKIKLIFLFTTAALLIILITALTQSSIMSKVTNGAGGGIRSALKNILESVTLSDTLVLNSLLQLLFLGVFLIWFKRALSSKLFLSVLWTSNLFIMAQLVLPASFVSKTSPKTINAVIHASPKGFPTDSLQNTLAANSKDAFTNFDISGLNYFYNKKIGISRVTNSPAFLIQQDSFTQTHLLYDYVSSLPVVYIADSVLQLKDTVILNSVSNCTYAFTDTRSSSKPCGSNTTAVRKLASNRIEIETETERPAFLVLSQNYYHHWKVAIDGEPGIIQKTNMSFMGTAIPAGKHTVVFRFLPANTIKALWIQLAVLITLLIAGLFSFYKTKKN